MDIEKWRTVDRQLKERGWTVDCRLMWVADATRGRDSERAVGATREEAYDQLLELAKLDELTGVP